jgi:hypothetical protein
MEKKEAGVVRFGTCVNLGKQNKCVGQLPSLYQMQNLNYWHWLSL